MKKGAKLIATRDELPLLINVGLEDYQKNKLSNVVINLILTWKILTTNTT
jgi:uncharacterized protein YpmS